MWKFAAPCLFLLLAFEGRANVLLDEIKTNLDDSQQKVEQARKQITELEANDDKLKKNLQQLETALNKKLDEQKQAKETHNDYSQKLTATGTARKEFERSLLKDRQELELVVRDIQIVERKLENLKAAKKALEQSIEISQDNLSKMNDRSGSWQKNRDHLQSELTGLDKDIVDLERQRDAQMKTRLENQQALNKWKQTLATQESAYQKLDSRYRQAVRDAERKEREKKR
jgi:chromosome segregation ATPase